MSKKKKMPSAEQFVTESITEGVGIGTALVLFLVKSIVAFLIIYFSVVLLMAAAAYLTVFFGSFLGVGYDAQMLDAICGTAIPGLVLGVFLAMVEYQFAKYLWIHLVQNSFRKLRAAIAAK